MNCRRFFAWVAGVAILCGSFPDTVAIGEELPLRKLVEGRSLFVGAAVRRHALPVEEEYRRILGREFSMVTAENAMKWGRLEPERGIYDFGDADRLASFAGEHRMAMRGHALIWHNQMPDWLTEEVFSAEEIGEFVRRHIFTLAGRYRGLIRSWDVVNEAFEDDGSWRDTLFLRVFGPDYVGQAFRWAHEADPEALLFYNDYSAEGIGPKSDAVYEMARRFVAEGVPIHGVGLQMHLVLDAHPPVEEIRANIRRLNALGLEVSITEMDVRIPRPVTPEKLERQARLYGEILDLALEAENCREFVLLGFTDRFSWIPGHFPETDEGLVFDREYRPKPAYFALRNGLKREARDSAEGGVSEKEDSPRE